MRLYSPLALLFFILGCSAPKAFYDFRTESTVFAVYPLGRVGLPGIWTKVYYARSTGQQHFVKGDTVLSVSITAKDDYPYYYQGNFTEFGFVKKYFDIESLHQMTKRAYEPKILLSDSSQALMIWKLNDPQNHYAIAFKCKGLTVYSIVVYGDWPDEYQISFLKRIWYD